MDKRKDLGTTRILKHCSVLRESFEHFRSEWPLGISCCPVRLAQVLQTQLCTHRVPVVEERLLSSPSHDS